MRIVFGSQDLFWAFLPKRKTQQIREWGKVIRGSYSFQELMKPIHAFKKAMGYSSCGQWLIWPSRIDNGLQ